MAPENQAKVKRAVLNATLRLAMMAYLAWWIHEHAQRSDAVAFYRQHPWIGVAVLAFAMCSAVMLGFSNRWLVRTEPGWWGVATSAIALFFSVLASLAFIWSLEFFGGVLGLIPLLLAAALAALSAWLWWCSGVRLKSAQPDEGDD